MTYWLGVAPEPTAPGPVTYTLTVDVPSELEVLPESIRAHAADGSAGLVAYPVVYLRPNKEVVIYG